MPEHAEFKFKCPTCGQRILAATDWIGLGISCPSCQSRITIPAPAAAATDSEPAAAPQRSRQTIRIELPLKPDREATAAKSQTNAAQPAPLNQPMITGAEPWSELVRQLEGGATAEPAVLATALFQELKDVRRRLDRLERQLQGEKQSGPMPSEPA